WDSKRRLRRQVSQHRAKRMSRIQLIVPVSEDHQRMDIVDPAPEELDQIQRRFVGPMDVLKEHDRRSLALSKSTQEERKQVVPVAVGLERAEQRPMQMHCNVAQRTKGSRCEQRVARAP